MDGEKTNYKTRELVSHVKYAKRELKADFTFVLAIKLLPSAISFIHSSELITLIKQTANDFTRRKLEHTQQNIDYPFDEKMTI